MTLPESFTVRVADGRDLDALVEGNRAMALDTEGLALDPAVLRRGVGAALSDPSRGEYLVAETEGGAFAGQLMLTREWSDWRAGYWLWIQSVHVVPAYRRRGVYRALHAAVLARAAASPEPVAGVRLYVERDNARAQHTYAAVGMAETHYRLYEQPLPR
jgi:GNAT superfamily N-acetyltransferase